MGRPHHRTLKPGDHVQLNGQGPVMTVIKYAEDSGQNGTAHSNFIVLCHWYDESGEKQAEYHQLHLVKVSNGKGNEKDAHFRVGHDRLIDPNDPTPGRS